MKNKGFLKTIVVLTAVFAILGGAVLVSQAQERPLERKIVVFKSGVLNESARDALVQKFGGVKIRDLKLIDAMSVILPPRAQARLAQHPDILRIDDDVEVHALGQILPWGIDKVDADLSWGISTGNPVKVAVIDTGIDLQHPDLIANIKGGYNAIRPGRTANDDNGHGTHVAGIVAAVDNTIGVVGVGPKIDLYAVKVLNAAGSGYLSDVIEGIDWAIANSMQIINLSLGTSSDVQSFHDAVQRANTNGIVQVAAAGNTGSSVLYPAAYPEIIAVSAIDSSDNIASWSSRGSEIDLAAPGVSIYSTYKNRTYKTLSGTSMAAPHVAGAAALVIDKKTCDYDSDGKCAPLEVKRKLQETATDLGGSGFDNLFGWGLVNVYQAIK